MGSLGDVLAGRLKPVPNGGAGESTPLKARVPKKFRIDRPITSTNFSGGEGAPVLVGAPGSPGTGHRAEGVARVGAREAEPTK